MKNLSIRNQLAGTVQEIVRGPVVSEVVVKTPAGTLASVITTRSVPGYETQERRPCVRDGKGHGSIDPKGITALPLAENRRPRYAASVILDRICRQIKPVTTFV